MRTAEGLGLILSAYLGGAACWGASGIRDPEYEGVTEPRIAGVDEVLERSGLPEGWRHLGSVRASCPSERTCRGQEPSCIGAQKNDACNVEALKQALRRKVAEVGGNVLYDTDCDQGESMSGPSSEGPTLHCKGLVAAPQ